MSGARERYEPRRRRTARLHRRGPASAEGYYRDAFDFVAFTETVLVPLGPGDDRRHRERVIDLATDEAIDDAPRLCPADAVVVVDGTFLQNPVLAPGWDEVVFLAVDLDVARARGVRRDANQLGGPELADRLYVSRYHAAARLYLAEIDPERSATIVVGHDDPAEPALEHLPAPRLTGGARP